MGVYAGLPQAWISYTPTVTLNGGGSNGNATITGAYQQFGKTVVFWMNYIIGNTTTFSGLTSINVSLPQTTSASFSPTTSGAWANGTATISGTTYLLTTVPASSTTLQLISQLASGTYLSADVVTATKPASWAVSSSFFISGTYEAA